MDIEVALDGTRSLYLVVDDAGDGYRCDWADWIEPRLVGPNGEQSLTELDWETATSDWGEVRKQRNAAGGPLRVAGESIGDGIGTHSRSIIHFQIPAGFTHFRARGGLDNGGTDQGGNASSVRFAVYTQAPPEEPRQASNGAPDRSPESAVANLDVHPKLEVELFAAEPLLLSPSNIDVDHRGRVWVCEVVNYRAHQGRREAGDRILILEDTDGDGRADRQKVFYQGRDVDSAHGVCVLGNRVIVSSGPHVLCFTDIDGDDRPDRKDVWFSRISGVQHDHGIHAFHYGPDGKLYFNFGNEGEQICDAQGNPIVDLAGNRVAATLRPYQQGMVFRCDLDLGRFETLGWNFRNNWMVVVDSFGTIWQSDNDDDGNRGVRINYVMEFGNYGFRDEMTGAGWQTPRIGMSEHIARRHWHQNDPGVVPNLLHTGAGSPTGIAVYEGNMLPSEFHGQLIHCDAGPSVVRAYVLAEDGAGFTARTVNLLEGTRDPWFRPSDVKVAPDGSLIVADWFDPGVGGHAMGDLERGRLFRVTAKLPADQSSAANARRYEIPTFDFSTPQGAVTALKNPNVAARYVASQSLQGMGEQAVPALEALAVSDVPHERARALWLLGKIPGRWRDTVERAAADTDARLRVLALRLATQLDDVDALSVVERLVDDRSPQVRRQCALALRGRDDPPAVPLWVRLAKAYDGEDRWYLEALGIAAEGRWDACLAAWLVHAGSAWDSPAGRQIVWRSRAAQTAERLRRLIEDPNTTESEIPRYLRAMDFQPEAPRVKALEQLAFESNLPAGRRELVRTQALYRLPAELLTGNGSRRDQLDQILDSLAGTQAFIELVRRFGLQHRFDQVLQLAAERPGDALGIDAMRMLLAAGQQPRLMAWIKEQADDRRLAMIGLLGRASDNRALPLLKEFMLAEDASPEVRRAAVQSASRLRGGAEFLLEQAQRNSLPSELVAAAAADLHQVPWDDLRTQSMNLFPVTPSKDNRPLRPLRDLAELRGDATRGEVVYRTTGTCIKCHIINGQGTAVGPELSQIGDKLSREAMFESIIYPSAGVSHGYESFVLELEDGNVISGLLVSQTDDAVTLKTSEGIERRVPRGDVAQLSRQPLSLMPADLHREMTEAELIDLVEYLMTLRNGSPAAAPDPAREETSSN